MQMCYIQNVNLDGISTVCFGILIVSLNTTSSHFFMYTLVFTMFGHGHLVLERSWRSTGQRVYEPGHKQNWRRFTRLR